LLVLPSGATILQNQIGEWVVVGFGREVKVSENPNAALLLLETPPNQNLVGFPYEQVILAGKKSNLPRYVILAEAWEKFFLRSE
jgi:carbonic anhydrase/acetyltransferase-like protein (isoleucine patch superfamily)